MTYELPEALRRDRVTNRAPFMDFVFIETTPRGLGMFTAVHSAVTARHIKEHKAALDALVVDVKFSTGWSPPHPALVNPEDNPPASTPNWVPPWASKY